MASSAHPSTHLWPALQRRFADQNKPSTAPDRLLRAFCVVPLEGQEASNLWSLGFKEVSSTLRTASLSRDFGAVAGMVDPEVPAYLVVYVGDVQDPLNPAATAPASALEAPRDWVLIAYVPSSCSTFEAKKMADNRAVLKAGLGPERFTEAGMWCVHIEQISLSSYMRASEASSSGADVTPSGEGVAAATGTASATATLTDLSDIGTVGNLSPPMGVLLPAGQIGAPGEELDATEAIWEERIKGVRHAYADSCARLVGALEELEETLCNLTGDPYRPDEPILRARAHMAKNLEAMRLTS